VLVALEKRDPADDFIRLTQDNREITTTSGGCDPRRCAVLRVGMGDREHPRHLDPRELALNDGGVAGVEGPEQKSVSLDPCWVRLDHESAH